MPSWLQHTISEHLQVIMRNIPNDAPSKSEKCTRLGQRGMCKTIVPTHLLLYQYCMLLQKENKLKERLTFQGAFFVVQYHMPFSSSYRRGALIRRNYLLVYSPSASVVGFRSPTNRRTGNCTSGPINLIQSQSWYSPRHSIWRTIQRTIICSLTCIMKFPSILWHILEYHNTITQKMVRECFLKVDILM